MKDIIKRGFSQIILSIIATTALLIFSAGCTDSSKIEWISPYKEINWENIKQAKAQLHTHTTRSDGRLSPQYIVDKYHETGYDILAITDHWLATWPWNDFASFEISNTTKTRVKNGEFDSVKPEDYLIYENRSPEKLNMIAVLGSEPSWREPRTHHMVSLFSNITGADMEFEEALAAAEKAGGLFSFAHPGRSVEKNNNKPEDYIHFLTKYQNIYGIDIFNRASYREPERFPYCRELISIILNHFGSPDNPGWRPVWLTATDDTHNPGVENIDRAFQIQLLDKLDQENVYKSLKEGKFFWAAKSPGENIPIINSIDFKKNIITVNGSGYEQIVWYSDNKIIHKGNTFDYKKDCAEDIDYLYFIAYTANFSVEGQKGAMIGSQPFWIVKKAAKN